MAKKNTTPKKTARKSAKKNATPRAEIGAKVEKRDYDLSTIERLAINNDKTIVTFTIYDNHSETTVTRAELISSLSPEYSRALEL